MIHHVTIDTNSINIRHAHADMNTIEALAERGLIQITTTFALAMDLEFDKTKFGGARRAKASRLPQARSGFMIGHSTVGGPDVIGGPDIYEHVDAIAEIIRPRVAWQKIDSNTQRDILHLAAHLTYKWEIFVTEDNGILKHAAQLSALNVHVMTPKSALQYLKEQGIS